MSHVDETDFMSEVEKAQEFPERFSMPEPETVKPQKKAKKAKK